MEWAAAAKVRQMVKMVLQEGGQIETDIDGLLVMCLSFDWRKDLVVLVAACR